MAVVENVYRQHRPLAWVNCNFLQLLFLLDYKGSDFVIVVVIVVSDLGPL